MRRSSIVIAIAVALTAAVTLTVSSLAAPPARTASTSSTLRDIDHQLKRLNTSNGTLHNDLTTLNSRVGSGFLPNTTSVLGLLNNIQRTLGLTGSGPQIATELIRICNNTAPQPGGCF